MTGYTLPAPAPGDDSTDTIQAVLDAAAAAGGGRVSLADGATYRTVKALRHRSKVTLVGNGATLFLDCPHNQGAYRSSCISWWGAYADSVRDPEGGNSDLTTINPTAAGSDAVTTTTEGGFAKWRAGDLCYFCEGPLPKLNYAQDQIRVVRVEGNTAYLDRPPWRAFDGTLHPSFGVLRIVPVTDAWVEDLVLAPGPLSAYCFATGFARGGGLYNCICDPAPNVVGGYNPPFANDSWCFTLEGIIFKHGMFGGFGRSADGRFLNSTCDNVGTSVYEFGEGERDTSVVGCRFYNALGNNPCFGMGVAYDCSLDDCRFSCPSAANYAIRLNGGTGTKITRSTFRCKLGIAVTSAFTSGAGQTQDVVIAGNTFRATDRTRTAILAQGFPVVNRLWVKDNTFVGGSSPGFLIHNPDATTNFILGPNTWVG